MEKVLQKQCKRAAVYISYERILKPHRLNAASFNAFRDHGAFILPNGVKTTVVELSQALINLSRGAQFQGRGPAYSEASGMATIFNDDALLGLV